VGSLKYNCCSDTGCNDISCISFVLPQLRRPTLDSVRLRRVTYKTSGLSLHVDTDKPVVGNIFRMCSTAQLQQTFDLHAANYILFQGH